MLETICPEFELDTEDPPMLDVEEFFRLLKVYRIHYTNTQK
jgi:hypothetical protein